MVLLTASHFECHNAVLFYKVGAIASATWGRLNVMVTQCFTTSKGWVLMDKCPSVWLSTSAWDTASNLDPANGVDLNWELTNHGSQGFGRSRKRYLVSAPWHLGSISEDAKAQVIMTEGENHQEACSLTSPAVRYWLWLGPHWLPWHVSPPMSFLWEG